MNGFVGFIEQKLMPVANKVGMQRHMVAIRKGNHCHITIDDRRFLFTILLNFPIESVAAFIEPYREVLRHSVSLYCWSVCTLCDLWYRIFIGKKVTKLDSLTAGILATMSF